jgi:hypothetical protein
MCSPIETVNITKYIFHVCFINQYSKVLLFALCNENQAMVSRSKQVPANYFGKSANYTVRTHGIKQTL